MKVSEREMYLRSARRGAAFLDRHVPGWRRMIRLSRLDMTEPFYSASTDPFGRGRCGCVLAQLSAYAEGRELGSYEQMRQKLHLGQRPRIARAFDGDMPNAIMRQVIREGR